MSGSSYAFQLTALLSPTAGLVKPGMCIVLDPGQERFFVATLAQRTALGRKADGVARTTGNGVNATVEWQTEGYLPAEISGLGPGISSYVRVGDTALLERVVSPLTTDQVVGTCETNGDVHLSVGGAGVPGSSGPFGGAVSAPWAYDTGTTNANPGSGKLRFDASSPPGATHMYISSTDLNGFFWLGFFAIVGGRSGSVIATLRIVRGANPNAFNLYEVTSITPHSGYYEFALSWVAGGTGYVSGETLWFLCDLVGDTGATGPAGPAPTGTGFAHVTGGVLDPAARAVDLSSSDVTGVLPLANEAAPTGTGVVRVSSGAWVTSGSKGTGLQLLRTTSGVTDVEWWTLSVDLASQVTGTLPIGSIGHGTNGQYLQTTSGVPTWTSPGSSNTVAVSNGTAVTWATIVDANVSGSAAIATSKLALPGSATEVYYRNGTSIGAAAGVSIASGGQLQVGTGTFATAGEQRFADGGALYGRKTATSANQCIAQSNGGVLYIGTPSNFDATKTHDQWSFNALSYGEFGVSATPASPTAADPYVFCQGTSFFTDTIGAVQAQGKIAFRTATGSTPQGLWGGGGTGTIFIGDTPTTPSFASAGAGSVLWSDGSTYRHMSQGGIVTQLNQGMSAFAMPNVSTYSINAFQTAQEVWDFNGSTLIQPCVITIPIPSAGDAIDTYRREVSNNCTDPRALIQFTAGGPNTATFAPGSRGVIVVSALYGVLVYATATGGISGGGTITVAAAGASTEIQYRNAGVLGAASNVLYVGGKLQLQTAAALEWANGASLGDLSWTPTAARTLTLPDATDTLVGRATTDTLTNKTIGVSQLSGVISVANGGTHQGALGTGLQVLRTNAGATDTEWATVASGPTVSGTGIAHVTSGAFDGTAFGGTGIPKLTSGALSLLTGFETLLVEEWNSNGTSTSPADATHVLLFGCGSGGGGGSGNDISSNGTGGAGGGGAECGQYFGTVSVSTGYAVVIGAAAAGGVSSSTSAGNAGTVGSDSTFGSLATFYGAAQGLGGTTGSSDAAYPGLSSRILTAYGTFPSAPPATTVYAYGQGGQGRFGASSGRNGVPSQCGMAGGTGGANSGTLGGGGGGGGGAFGPGGNGSAGATSTAGSDAAANSGAGGGGSGSRSGATGKGGNGGSGKIWAIYLRAVA